MKTITHNGLTWLDIENPTESDLSQLKEGYKIHPQIAMELLPPRKRPEIEEHKDQLWMVLHFPIFDPKTRKTEAAEIDFIVVGNTLITAHQKSILPLEVFLNDCQLQDKKKEDHLKSAGWLIFSLVDHLIDSCLPMLDHIHEHIDHIEEAVFKGHEKEMLHEISIVKRDIIDFRRTIKPQRGVLELLAKKAPRFFDEKLERLSQEVIGSNIRVWNTLENHKEMIEAIEKTNESLLSYKTNEAMKVLTMIAAISFPLAVIAGIFSMGVFHAYTFPENPLTPLIILTIMLIIVLGMTRYFKKKNWL